MRCTAKTKSGEKCKAIVLKNENKCFFHSTSERANKIRTERAKRILTNEELIVILQTELRKVKKSKNDEYRSGETRRIIELISELKGERPPAGNGKKSSSFEEAIKKCQSEK